MQRKVAMWTSFAATALAMGGFFVSPEPWMRIAMLVVAGLGLLGTWYASTAAERADRRLRGWQSRRARQVQDEEVRLHGRTREMVGEVSEKQSAVLDAAAKMGANRATLRIASVDLADRIAKFFDERQKLFTGEGDWSPQRIVIQQAGANFGLSGPYSAHDRETCSAYWRTFGPEVNELRDRIAVAGYRDSALDRVYRTAPTDNSGICFVINGLMALAKRLDEE